MFAARASAVLGHRQVEGFERVERFRVVAEDERPFPVQVDGDYAGEFEEVTYTVAPRSLSVVS